jgi:hypothetical protein
MKELLKSMVYQFGYRIIKNGKTAITTGGLSVLEEAFKTLEWNDPHFISEDNLCEIEGCYLEATSGKYWKDMYLKLCTKHSIMCAKGKRRPDVKLDAKIRELNRDKKTGILLK